MVALSGRAAAKDDARGDAGAPPPLPACIQVTTQSRYIPFGYNHIVIVTNGCAQPASCIVSTDVNPKPETAEVASNTTVEVLTFMSAASSTFTARVSCRLH